MRKSKEDIVFERLLNDEGDNLDIIYEFISALRKDYPLQAVSDLVNSPNRKAHSAGLLVIEKLSSEALPLKELIINFGKNGTPYEKFVFVEFCISTKIRDCRLIEIFTELLNDFDVIIRAKAIIWTILANKDDLANMEKHICASAKIAEECDDKIGKIFQRRKERAFRIAGEIRQYNASEDFESFIDGLKDLYPREDEVTFEYMIVYKYKIVKGIFSS
ncbi:hypothetical protein SH611_22920 [Geminicoccaceae bacterium 1502E]|nr:hypothetical protein [Geminicoccaceae bacterium 1502E]